MPKKRQDSRSDNDNSTASSSDGDSSDSSSSEKFSHRRSRKDHSSKSSTSRDVKHSRDHRQPKEGSSGQRQVSSRHHSSDSSRRRSPAQDSRRGEDRSGRGEDRRGRGEDKSGRGEDRSDSLRRRGEKDRQQQDSDNRRNRDTDLKKVGENKNRMDHKQRSHDREPEKDRKGKSTSYSKERTTRNQGVKDGENYLRQQEDAGRKDDKNLDADTRIIRNESKDSKVNPAQKSSSKDSLKEKQELKTALHTDIVDDRVRRGDNKQSPEKAKIKLHEKDNEKKRKVSASSSSSSSSEGSNSSESDSDAGPVKAHKHEGKRVELSKESKISRRGKSEVAKDLDSSKKSEEVKVSSTANKKSENTQKDTVERKKAQRHSESDSDFSANEKDQNSSSRKRRHSKIEENTQVEVLANLQTVNKVADAEKQLGLPLEKGILKESEDEKEEGELSEENEDKIPDKPLKAISDYVSDISSDDGQPDVTELPQPLIPPQAKPTSHVLIDIVKESDRNVEQTMKSSSKADKTDKKVVAKKKAAAESKSGAGGGTRKSSNFSDHEVVEGEDNSMRQRPVLESESDDDRNDEDTRKNAVRSNIQSKQKIGSSVLIVRQEQAKQDHDRSRGRDAPRGRGREDSHRRDKRERDTRPKPDTDREKRREGNYEAKKLSDESEQKDKPNPKSAKPDTTPATKTPEEPTKKTMLAFDITSKAGGAYIPPAKLRMMQERITDKTSAAYQRMSWEALKKSINGIVNKINVSNAIIIVKELFQENIVRGRGLLARSVIQAQAASPTFTHVYAALVAIINTKFPQNGELILRRLILMFRRGFKRNDKAMCLSTTTFIAHLVNQQVAHEVLALEILTLLLENPTDDSVEIAVGFLKECGLKLSEISPRGMNSIFEQLRNILHEGMLDKRVQYMVEVMFAVRKDGFKDHPSVLPDLDLVEEDDQFTHLLQLEDAVTGDEMLNVFREDPTFAENEEKYKTLKKEILAEGSSDEDGEGSSGSGSSDSDSDDEEKKNAEKQIIIDKTETNLIALRRIIYLTIQSSLDHNECAHKMLKMELKPGQEVELCNMILDCCAQLRTYEKFYGLLAQRFCQIDRKYIEPFQQIFLDQYETIHRLETNKLRNVAKFFSHMLYTDAISWGVLSVIKLTEEDTTSASRIFLKTLFQELSEYMGLLKLNERLKDPTLSPYFTGIMARDNPKNTRFCINFFTTIGLGGLTDDLREHLKATTKQIAQQNLEDDQANKGAISSSSGSSSGSSDSDSSSDSDASPKRKRNLSAAKTKKKTEKENKKSKKKATGRENKTSPRIGRRSLDRDSHSESRSKSSDKGAVAVSEKNVSSDRKTIADRLLDMAQYGNVRDGDTRSSERAGQPDRAKEIPLRQQFNRSDDKERTGRDGQEFYKNRENGQRWPQNDRRFYGDNRDNRRREENMGYRNRDGENDGRKGGRQYEGNNFRRREEDSIQGNDAWDRRPDNARRWKNNYGREDKSVDVDRPRDAHRGDKRKERRHDSSSEDSGSSPELARKRHGGARDLSPTPEKRQGRARDSSPTPEKRQGRARDSSPTPEKRQGRARDSSPTPEKRQGKARDLSPTPEKRQGRARDSSPTPEKRRGKARDLSPTPEKRHRKQSLEKEVVQRDGSKKRLAKYSSDSSDDDHSQPSKSKREISRPSKTRSSLPAQKTKRKRSLSSSGSSTSSTSSSSSSDDDDKVQERRIVTKKSRLSGDRDLRPQETVDRRSGESNRAKKRR